MLIKHSQQDIVIDLLDRIKRVGVKISGGADSAVLCYIITKYINDERPDIILVPITIEKDVERYHFKFSSQVVDFCKKEFPTVKFGEHRKSQHLSSVNEHNDEQTRFVLELMAKKVMDCHFLGVTANPPVDMKFYDEYGREHTAPPERDVTNELKPTEATTTGYYISYRPFMNINKKGIYELYKKFDLLESLFPLTRSCECDKPEETDNFTKHCNHCWDCGERKWGFGRIN